MNVINIRKKVLSILLASFLLSSTSITVLAASNDIWIEAEGNNNPADLSSDIGIIKIMAGVLILIFAIISVLNYHKLDKK